MVFHFFQGIEPSSGILSVLTKVSVFGQTGVTLFFVLSGFLITRILLATKETSGYFKNFYLRRTLRIFPLYYLFLLLSYYVLPLLFQTSGPAFSQQIFHFTYLQNFATTFNWNASGPSHFWSLAVEEHFYLFWPFIVYLFSNKNLTKIILGIILGAMILRAIMVSYEYEVFYFTFTRFDSLAIGSFLAILEQRNVFIRQNSNKFLMILVCLLIPTIIMWTYFTGTGNTYIQVFKFSFLSFIYFSIIGFVLCIENNHIINRVLKTHFFSYTGKISYGLYVYHPFAYSICAMLIDFDNILLNLVMRFIMTYLISSLSFHLFESSFLRLKKYFEYN